MFTSKTLKLLLEIGYQGQQVQVQFRTHQKALHIGLNWVLSDMQVNINKKWANPQIKEFKRLIKGHTNYVAKDRWIFYISSSMSDRVFELFET